MKQSPVAVFAYNVRVSLATVGTAFGIAVAVGVLAGFIPAWRSSRASIIEGLRQVV